MLNAIIMAIIGGGLIGLAASGILLFVGRIAGISGIVGGIPTAPKGDRAWRIVFVAGLFIGGLLMTVAMPSAFDIPTGRSLPAIAIAGLLVGFGTRLGNGCTSGHGVCGLTRLSKRSTLATLTFMFTGALVATGARLFFGGVL